MNKKKFLVVAAFSAFLLIFSACSSGGGGIGGGTLTSEDIAGVYEGTGTFTKIVHEEGFDPEDAELWGEKIYEVGDTVHALCYVEAVSGKLVDIAFVFDYDEDFDEDEDTILASYDSSSGKISFTFGERVTIELIASKKDEAIVLEGFEDIDMGEAWGAKALDLELVKISD